MHSGKYTITASQQCGTLNARAAQAKAAEDKQRVADLKNDAVPPSKAIAKEEKPKVARAKTPYIFFCAEKRDTTKANHPQAGFGDIAKLLAGGMLQFLAL